MVINISNTLIEKSLRFHLKHCEFTDKENVFASYYNIGIASRFIKKFKESVDSFKKGLEWAHYRDVILPLLLLGL
jgi:hypothetical protein